MQAGFRACFFVFLMVLGMLATAASAQERGAVTHLPIPRFVSLKAAEGNMRRGPSLTHKIDWVLTRRGMPLQVIDEFGHWRRVRDKDGARGWIHYSLLSGARSVVIETDLVALRAKPNDEAMVQAYLEAGVIARLEACELDWCRVRADGHRGWLLKTAVWGVTPEELKD